MPLILARLYSDTLDLEQIIQVYCSLYLLQFELLSLVKTVSVKILKSITFFCSLDFLLFFMHINISFLLGRIKKPLIFNFVSKTYITKKYNYYFMASKALLL